MTITKDQANEILILASIYADYSASAEAVTSKYAERMEIKAQETWLKLKELVESITEE